MIGDDDGADDLTGCEEGGREKANAESLGDFLNLHLCLCRWSWVPFALLFVEGLRW